MGRKRQDLKTYGRHRQRVVTTIDEWKAKQEKHHCVFSNSGSSDHLFSSSASSTSNLWDSSHEGGTSFKGNDQENPVFGRTRSGKLQTSSSSNESVSYGRQRNAKRRALKDIQNGDVAGKELDERLGRRKKIMCYKTNTKADDDAISAEGNSKLKSQELVKSNRKDSVMNFSEFEDYSLIMSDSLIIEDEVGADVKIKLKRAHSTPAFNERKGKKSRCESSTSTPVCKSLTHQLSLESLKDSDLSHIRSFERICETDNILDYSDMNSLATEDMEESNIYMKLSLVSDGLKQLQQSSLSYSAHSPSLSSLRNGKSFQRTQSKHNSLHNSGSNSYLFRKSRSSHSLKPCSVNVQSLGHSLLQHHLEKVLTNNDSHRSLTPFKNNSSFCRVFNSSDSLFSSCPNSQNEKSSKNNIVAVRNSDSSVSSDSLILLNQSENLSNNPQNETEHCSKNGGPNETEHCGQNEDPDETESYLETDSDLESDHSSLYEKSDYSEAEDPESSEHSENSDSETELGEVKLSRMSLRNTKGCRKVRFSGAAELNFSNTCYTLTEEGEMNDWSTDDVADQLANITIEDKGIDISDPSAYCTANSHISIIAESDGEELEDGEVEEGEILQYSSQHTGEESRESDKDLFSQRSPSSNSQKAIENLQKSFSEMLTPRKKSGRRKSLSPRSKILLQCEQTDFVPFSTCIPQDILSSCVKIGEGVYGEVFRPQLSDPVAFKVIPIEGDFPVNDEAQKTFGEILPEIIISRELSALQDTQDNRTDNFIAVNRVLCVQGCYPKELLEQWDEYDRKKNSENDRPDKFGESQLFIMFEFADGGCDLESFKFKNILEVKSVLVQVAYALAVAEVELEFEHRDLHWGNVLVRKVSQDNLHYSLQGSDQEIQTQGIHISIIDFTLSRLTKEGCTVFCDLSTDDTLYDGKGDYQFDIYRVMKEENGNKWEPFNPHTNILWLHYLVDKLTTKKSCTVRSKAHKDIQRELRLVKKSMLDYESAYDLISHSEFFQS